ncbi:Roy1p [Kluyveromyces lactis]|uniref:KLLA0B08635p n=1 Tax=Kluyveromyces lactis (strain ATCC 8585 / CBS 2359 / DSM 70799 / NBRC 1267 / NRRL Y-1140 / WM37) TaxID=284590 RepID=Q6CVX7_KLULA|nr:uncharacterized protein KLLA0_B08635g [Kluyveromyces lactis]CAH02305.1 KLLA0B08635p [Kluyveromyces lactis]|eukprot:XP_451912.1 uncharacterized protein KLLA0_B08635g [Kluyveromyces lactis]
MTQGISLEDVFDDVANFLNQNDLASLCLVSRRFNELATPRLYADITINKNPVLRSKDWWIECGKTYVAGYRSITKSNDQNDLFLYDRICRLLESKHLYLIRTLVVQEDVFNDTEAGMPLLQRLIDSVRSLNQVTNLDIRDSVLFQANKEKLKGIRPSKVMRIQEIGSLNDISDLEQLKSLEIFVTLPSFDNVILSDAVKFKLLANLEELVIEDIEFSSLRVFYYFKEQGVVFTKLKSVKFNHVHGIHDYNKTYRELTADFLKEVIPLKQLQSLEMELACEMSECTCIDDFLSEISSELVSLRNLALIEKTFVTQGDHYTEENWDLSINRFILHLPNVSQNLQTLSVRHNCPINGIQKDSVEGNYIRRRTLYEEVLPHLKSLKKLFAPTILQSLSSYEILVCDLLWNGCECEKCTKVLDIFDQFIQNHQYYSYEEGQYKDIIPTVFFAYAGDSLCRRFLTETDWDLKALQYSPTQQMWDFHGYENVYHFQDYNCHFDESAYTHLTQVISHFFDDYMKTLVKLLPNLTVCLLSGIYYQVSDDRQFSSQYDR